MIRESAGRTLASAGGVFESIDRKWRGVIAICAAISVGFTAGIGFLAFAGDYATHETRIVTLEEWRVAHEDTVSTPAMNMARSNREAIEDQREDWEMVTEMVRQMYCEGMFPERCPRGLPEGQ